MGWGISLAHFVYEGGNYLLKDASKPVAQPRGRFFAIMGQFSGEKL